jgi:hypothetical protein
VEHTAELPLSQGALLVDPYDKEELCDISSFTISPQLDGEHTLVSCSAPNIFQENEIRLPLSEETIPEPSPTCENKNCIDDMPFIVCSAMSNFGQNKKDLATQSIEVESEKGKSICAELNHVNDETHSLTMASCEPIALVLNLSTTSTSLEQSLVELVTEFPLLQDDYKIVSFDKEKLCDHTSLISTTQLVHGYDNSILDDTHAEVRRIHCIDSEKEELKITSSINCLGYIEFDFVCHLNSLENELF